MRLLTHRAKLNGCLDGTELFDNGVGARSTLLIDDRASNCEKWHDIGGHTYIPSHPNEVGLEVDLSIERLRSPGLWSQHTPPDQIQELEAKRQEALQLTNTNHWDEWVQVWENDNKAAGEFWMDGSYATTT